MYICHALTHNFFPQKKQPCPFLSALLYRGESAAQKVLFRHPLPHLKENDKQTQQPCTKLGSKWRSSSVQVIHFNAQPLAYKTKHMNMVLKWNTLLVSTLLILLIDDKVQSGSTMFYISADRIATPLMFCLCIKWRSLLLLPMDVSMKVSLLCHFYLLVRDFFQGLSLRPVLEPKWHTSWKEHLLCWNQLWDW